jgi:ATP-dependent Clp protease ATP-binding subunit ClpA
MNMGRRGELGFGDGKKDVERVREEKTKEKIMEVLREQFKPEFLNRVDEIIMFHPLGENDIRAIVDLQLAQVIARLQEKKITLEVPDKVRDWLGKKGYDPNLGARPLKRIIQTKLLDPLAMEIISHHLIDGDRASVNIDKDQLLIKKLS